MSHPDTSYKGPTVPPPTSLPPPPPSGQSEIDFILIRQSQKIQQFINTNRLSEAMASLRVVKELWCSLEYEYKYTELTKRIRDARHGH